MMAESPQAPQADTVPDLPPRHLPPPGWRWHSFTTPSGEVIRFGAVSPGDRVPDAIVIGLQGLSEFTEKYFEVAHDCLDRNLAFWMMDWRGQGKSHRPLRNRHKRHAVRFDNDVDDLHTFLMEYVKHAAVHPDVGRIPLVMLAHSMGANIGLNYMCRYPEAFACAALNAPMTGIAALKGMPPIVSHILTSGFRMAAGQAYAFGGGNWDARTFARHVRPALSADPVRAAVHDTWYRHDPDLQVGNVTFGWLDAAHQSCRRLRLDPRLKDIKTPCLFTLAGREHLVDNDATYAIASRLPHADIIELPDAHHEVLMETDAVRRAFFKAFDDFLAAHNIKDKIKPF